MKKQVLKIATVVFIGLLVIACKKSVNKTDAKDAEKVSQSEGVRYIANAEVSTIAWKGSKPTKSHNGTIDLSEGYLTFDNGELSGGNFIIDMKTIKNIDVEDPEWNGKLVGHLLSPDFFDVENHSHSIFTITGVDNKDGNLTVKGNLTIKGIKKNIEFPATATVNGDEATLKSSPFTIDRTEWDVKYNSGKFFEDLKDKLINDDIELVVDIKAKKN